MVNVPEGTDGRFMKVLGGARKNVSSITRVSFEVRKKFYETASCVGRRRSKTECMSGDQDV